MKAFVFLLDTGTAQTPSPVSPVRIVTLLLLLILCWQPRVLGQTDDFNDANDAGWAHLDLNTGTGGQLPPASYTFPDDGFGGKAYRISVAAPPLTNAGPARAFTYFTNLHDNFYLAVDLVGWDNSLNQAFGFLIRASDMALGRIDGYIVNYDPNQGAGGRGQFQINVVTEEEPITLAEANISLDPTHRYRLVMTAAASTLTAYIYDFPDLTTPLVTISADDETYSSGVAGLFVSSRVRSAEYTNPNTGKVDVTFDNYIAVLTAPSSVEFPATPHPIPDMPQVVNRTPGARANFHPYNSGIRFTATTLTTNTVNTSAIKLYLNGADVSSGLAISNGAEVSFDGLASNRVYDARIVLSDFSGRTSTNEFTFDTFDESFFDSRAVKVIEAEDYNYASGQFQDDPPPSGLNAMGLPVNGGGVGYYDLIGTAGIDYFDRSTLPGSGAAPEYRTGDFVGTQAGSADAIPEAGVINDTIRQKYATNDLAEYQVRGTEGGEWLNYTRVFTNASYNVYLRAACRAAQPVYFDQVTSDPAQPGQITARFGVFNVPNTTMLIHYRYAALTGADGTPVALTLSGTNTVRLTLGGPQTNVTQQTMALNYLLFVPIQETRFVLQSSAVAPGPYSDEPNAVYDSNAFKVTTPRSGAVRFYRVRTTSQSPSNRIRVASIQVAGADVVITADFLR